MSSVLEEMITRIDTLEEFEQTFSDEFLDNDDHIGNYLAELLWKYDCKASVVSTSAMLTHSYVGNIVNGKKRNPSRDALICICLTIGTTVEEVQYLLEYAGQAPLYVRRKRDVIIWFGFMKKMSLDSTKENRTRQCGSLQLRNINSSKQSLAQNHIRGLLRHLQDMARSYL